MKIYTDLSLIPKIESPIGLTVGVFDGVHLGHQFLLKKLKKYTPFSAVVTFANHPLEVLKKNSFPLICTLEHKLLLLEQAKVDLALVLTFTEAFSELSYKQFLKQIYHHLPFSHFVVGKGTVMGKARQGDETHIKALAHEMAFEADYVEKFSEEGKIVSSGRIRDLIGEGKISEVSALLGRPYSIYALCERGYLQANNLCILPAGSYAVSILAKGKQLRGKATITELEKTIAIEAIEKNLLFSGFIEVIFEEQL